MNVIPNSRWPAQRAPVRPAAPVEPAEAGPTRILLVLLSELRHAQLEVARIEAEIAPHARAFADALGEKPRPTSEQLRGRFGLNR